MNKALVIVDMQNDYMEEGAVPVTNSNEVAERLAEFIDNGGLAEYNSVIIIQTWHVEAGDHFSEDPDYVSSWPVHCLPRTWGSEISENLRQSLMGFVNATLRKGQFGPAYSAFDAVSEDGTSLEDVLLELRTTDVDIAGMLVEGSVSETAFDATERGFVTTVLTDVVTGSDPNRIEQIFNHEFPNFDVKIRSLTQ